ncbi:MAG: hypothetical protein ACOYOS_02390 [Syntrophales bacterium]
MDRRAEEFPGPAGDQNLEHMNGFGNRGLNGDALRQDVSFSEKQIIQIRKLTQIGRALSAERDIGRLLEMIVQEAREFTGADGATLYTISDDETELKFATEQRNREA